MKTKLCLLLFTILLNACSTSQQNLLPTGDSTMLELWNEKTGQGTLNQGRIQLHTQSQLPRTNVPDEQEQHSYTRDVKNETKNLFPRLPNPDLVMYIYPHLSDTGEPLPVPGYSTVIPFYSRVQYAQPGERTTDY
ncbi:TIGR03751 family conjugal transfer lipoprotein [Mergibacter septicus]|uniref:TIGR03751 family conjugal transfer lipoprotein n=1 Tax=Mergibacter septicus TaxID=221402 RepID=A0A8E3SBD3_9PAST|nr:TIGR03751 family conjugal transfer lipoprotein [Mergibacter septicus]AWX14719.1 TIGR03751 family conjugal transfer lipoprotein [Mergibacter septicus]QDJ13970.1 TIGR03751 family conjugal transfer lipoprotein [Mergibacter septicus]UTU48580.1 TIGR03751 family conjugal transfer lipoprotein [Mergibacter septicus]WMR95790.1 TIGR03751 family conjugal transfer lipoprotein [Mergibacter septicus]